jgi:hypothetical protein
MKFYVHKYLYIKLSETHTLLHLCNSYVWECQTPLEFSANWSRVYISSIIHLYKKKSITAEPNWLQHDHPTNHVIIQHYSSTVFVSLLFHFPEGKIWHVSKCHCFTFFTLLKKEEVSKIV